MNVANVEAVLIKVHQEIQRDGGYDPTAVQATTCPLRELPGFDSLLIPVVFRTLARELGISLPPDYRVQNIYVTSAGDRQLSISEIAVAACMKLSPKVPAKAVSSVGEKAA